MQREVEKRRARSSERYRTKSGIVDDDIIHRCWRDLTCGGLVELRGHQMLTDHPVYRGLLGEYVFSPTDAGLKAFQNDSEEHSRFR